MGSRRKRRRIIIVVVVCVAMLTTACSKSDTYLDMCDEENINYDIGDLKVIKTKYKSFEECEKIAKLIYENYFQYKEGVEREEYDGIVDICNHDKQHYALMQYGRGFVYYISEPFGEDYIYESTEEKVIEEETEKLLELVGLEYLGENGYHIEKIKEWKDNHVEVYLKKCIKGYELSITGGTREQEVTGVECVRLKFGNNQLIGIDLSFLSDLVEITDYEEDVVVDTWEKAEKLVENYIISCNFQYKNIEKVQITYVDYKEDEDICTLIPMAEFAMGQEKEDEGYQNVYQVNLSTKEIIPNEY